MSRRDFVALLMLAVFVLIFVAYEMAGLTIPGLHTVSFYAQNYPVIFWAILVAIPASALGLIVWWWHHIRSGRIPR